MKNYINIPEPIASDTRIKCPARVLYGFILKIHSMNKNGCFAQNEYFCKRIGIKDRMLTEYLNQLEHMGYIKIYRRRDKEHRIVSRRLVPLIKIAE